MNANFIINYWSQLTVLLGLLGYILKTISDYRLKEREVRSRYYYELKASKILEIHSRIVELQMIIDRRKKEDSVSFEANICKHRIELDKYYWESSFFLTPTSEKAFKTFLEWLKFFELKQMLVDDPMIEKKFHLVTRQLVADFKNEII